MFVESAQNLSPEKSQGGREAWHVTVIHPFGDHAPSCVTLAFESEYSCSAPLTLLSQLPALWRSRLVAETKRLK